MFLGVMPLGKAREGPRPEANRWEARYSLPPRAEWG